jgi:peptide deformylase
MSRSPQRRPIIELGHPTLRQNAAPIGNIADDHIQELADDLLYTCSAEGAMGIAAPQIGEPLRMFILASKPCGAYPQAPIVKPVVVINPAIVKMGRFTESAYEGCLSIPGYRAKVFRPTKITVRYQLRDGSSVNSDMDGFLARVFQHEYDHLGGKLFIDIMERNTLISQREYDRQAAEALRSKSNSPAHVSA